MSRAMDKDALGNYVLITLLILYSWLSKLPLEEVLNLLWMILVSIYLLVPKFFYKKKYLHFVIGYTITLILGIITIEGIIESDADLSDLLTLWTWTHELPEIFLPVSFITLIKIVTDLTIKQNLLVNLEKERVKSEMKFLKSQLSPHVLFNNLNNIYSFALHQSEHTPNLILKLADVMRYMVYDAQQDKVPLEKELLHLDNYVELQRIQLENRGELIYETIGKAEHLQIAPMMLISFIENCFKHASATSINNLKIIIQVEISEDSINLFTENSFNKKDAADTETILQEGGIGLNNVKRRLKLVYPEEHTLIIKELKNLYIVHLSIQLKPLS